MLAESRKSSAGEFIRRIRVFRIAFWLAEPEFNCQLSLLIWVHELVRSTLDRRTLRRFNDAVIQRDGIIAIFLFICVRQGASLESILLAEVTCFFELRINSLKAGSLSRGDFIRQGRPAQIVI
ncbi:hypothetical protein Rs2_41109 [Raphanus sativus]|nr:hypothetical protein Rs2_41109 [Raphanus sativus]